MLNHVRAAQKIARECACIRVRQASRVLTRIYDAQIRSTGLQDSQLSVLVAVAHFGESGASMGALADALVMDRTTLTRNLKPLEKAGLVRVARSPHDARARVVLLSRAGERTVESALPLWERAQKQVRDALGPALLDRLSDDLGRVVTLGAADKTG
jgi:DNA-binding MarR family transcriptional regulator